ncbi:hypothetical protein EJB05_49190 [Eragrostis curvula]|uniref:Uncharacterized protein n=1 Tax=Eragrostis curvula TaxID=38414 RepID=A0A5J9T3P0_9POAL|nr:hypothetical protein EJB05_49190 [Eragrostis curvula]
MVSPALLRSVASKIARVNTRLRAQETPHVRRPALPHVSRSPSRLFSSSPTTTTGSTPPPTNQKDLVDEVIEGLDRHYVLFLDLWFLGNTEGIGNHSEDNELVLTMRFGIGGCNVDDGGKERGGCCDRGKEAATTSRSSSRQARKWAAREQGGRPAKQARDGDLGGGKLAVPLNEPDVRQSTILMIINMSP